MLNCLGPIAVVFVSELWHLSDSSGLRRIWNRPSTTHSNLVRVLSDDLPVFDKSCFCSLLFINNCYFLSSSLVKFVSRCGYSVYCGILFRQYRSNLGSNFLSLF